MSNQIIESSFEKGTLNNSKGPTKKKGRNLYQVAGEYFPFNATRSREIAKWVAEIYWDHDLIQKCFPGNSHAVIRCYLLHPEHRDPDLQLKHDIKVLWNHHANKNLLD